MDVVETILTRHSVRSFLDKEVPDEVVETILRAAMAGPCCVNARDWEFLVTRDPEVMNRLADGNGGPAAAARHAKLCVLICGNLDAAFPPAKDYWVIDGAIAGQNMTLAAQGLGLGSVWLGTWPQMERVERQRELFNLPEHIVPHSLIAFGYPDPDKTHEPKREPPKDMPEGSMPPPPKAPAGAFDPELVHTDRW